MKSHSPAHHGYNPMVEWLTLLWLIFLQVAMKAEGFPCWPQNILIFHFRLQSLQHTVRNSRSRYPTNHGNSRFSFPFSFSSRWKPATPSGSPELLWGFCCPQIKLDKIFQSNHPSNRKFQPSNVALNTSWPIKCRQCLTSGKSFNGQIVHLQLELCLVFHFPALQHDYKSIVLLFWTSPPPKMGIRVHILNECLLKSNLTSLGAADAEQEHRGVEAQREDKSLLQQPGKKRENQGNWDVATLEFSRE